MIQVIKQHLSVRTNEHNKTDQSGPCVRSHFKMQWVLEDVILSITNEFVRFMY